MAEGVSIEVEVAYALPQRQDVIKVSLPEGATLIQAIEASGLMQRYPDIDLGRVGIFGKLAKKDTPLRDHDRVEIYRPLIADPKEVRKQRAAEGKALKKGAE